MATTATRPADVREVVAAGLESFLEFVAAVQAFVESATGYEALAAAWARHYREVAEPLDEAIRQALADGDPAGNAAVPVSMSHHNLQRLVEVLATDFATAARPDVVPTQRLDDLQAVSACLLDLMAAVGEVELQVNGGDGPDVAVGHHWQWNMLDGDEPAGGEPFGYCLPVLARVKLDVAGAGLDTVRMTGVAVVRCAPEAGAAREDGWPARRHHLRAFELYGMGPLLGPVMIGLDWRGTSTLSWTEEVASTTDRLDASVLLEVQVPYHSLRLRGTSPVHLFGRARGAVPEGEPLRSSGEAPLADGRTTVGALVSLDLRFGQCLKMLELPAGAVASYGDDAQRGREST